MTPHQWREEFDKLFDATYWAEIASEFAYGDIAANKVIAFIERVRTEAIKEDHQRIIARIEEQKASQFEARTILDGLVVDLEFGRLFTKK